MNVDDLKPLQKWLKDECNLPFALTELFNLEVLNLSNKNLQSIHPDINLLTNLQDLFCYNNPLLTRLELNCPKLKDLFCYNNQLTSLDLNCPNLQRLYCHNNQLTSLDLNCPNLQILDCDNNKLTSLELNCPKLQRLNCDNNPFSIKINRLSHKLFKKFNFKGYNIIEESKITELL